MFAVEPRPVAAEKKTQCASMQSGQTTHACATATEMLLPVSILASESKMLLE